MTIMEINITIQQFHLSFILKHLLIYMFHKKQILLNVQQRQHQMQIQNFEIILPKGAGNDCKYQPQVIRHLRKDYQNLLHNYNTNIVKSLSNLIKILETSTYKSKSECKMIIDLSLKECNKSDKYKLLASMLK